MARAFIANRRVFATLVLIAALGMKLLVPAGFMIGPSSKVLTVLICNDGVGNYATKQLVLPTKGKSHTDSSRRHGTDSSCPYSALSMASTSNVDETLLTSALAFVLSLVFASPIPDPPARIFHLRPPLRGPPAIV